MKPKYELVSTEYNGSTLHGLVHRVDAERGLVVHVHGTWGNFYGNPFVEPLTEAYASRGFSFAALNFPGHDETAIAEHIEDFPGAFDAWISLLGGDAIILEGHSLGAVKAAFMLNQEPSKSGVAGVVLLAPFDVVAFYSRPDGDASSVLTRISHLEDQEFVPGEIFDIWQISAGTLRQALREAGPWDQFPTREGSLGQFLARGDIPTLVQVGSDDFAASPNPAEVIRVMSSGHSTRALEVTGAPHNFAGTEAVLCANLVDWLDEQFGRTN